MFVCPASDDDLQQVEVEYKTLPGWKVSTEDARKFSDLPTNAQNYINTIKDFLGVPGTVSKKKYVQTRSVLIDQNIFFLFATRAARKAHLEHLFLSK